MCGEKFNSEYLYINIKTISKEMRGQINKVKNFGQFLNESESNKDDLFKTIKIGASYKDKYLSPNETNSEEITPKSGYDKSYLITNKVDQPLFKGILNVLPNGGAVMNVNYVTYSGVKNKYTNYFDKNGNEIIDNNNSTKREFDYFKAQL